jgi:tripartite-type tricarboxylate transporter receptor subunit TctC
MQALSIVLRSPWRSRRPRAHSLYTRPNHGSSSASHPVAPPIRARAMSDAFGKALGQPVVSKQPGNGSSIAADMVAKSQPDGYTLLIASPSSISVNPALNPSLSYTAKDLIAVTKMTTSPLVLAVNPATGIRSVPDLIAAAKKDPGKLNYSTSGNGSAPHLGAALFCQLTGTQMTHLPYRGGSPAIQSCAGDTQLTFGHRHRCCRRSTGGLALAVSTQRQLVRAPGMKEPGCPTTTSSSVACCPPAASPSSGRSTTQP